MFKQISKNTLVAIILIVVCKITGLASMLLCFSGERFSAGCFLTAAVVAIIGAIVVAGKQLYSEAKQWDLEDKAGV